MSDFTDDLIPKPKERLKFIDMARSIAILLMLEGHFIDLTLGDQFRTYPRFVDPDFIVYDVWHLIRGYTSPMFLTMTGLIFVYLLYRNKDISYRENPRVKKGFKRAFELLFWGYLLNPYGFHILQCISFGIMGILIIYALQSTIKFLPLWFWYFSIAVAIFGFNAFFMSMRIDGAKVAWPIGYPNFIQNIFQAPGSRSLFPLVPNLGYTFVGAGIGVLLHQNWLKVRRWNMPIFLLLVGFIFALYSTEILYFLHYKMIYFFGFGMESIIRANWLFEIQGWIFVILGVLAAFEKVVTIKDNLFLKIGQNTLVIFIVHMMILYGAVIRIGISDFFSRSKNPLNPYEAGIGAALFIGLFVFMIYRLEWFMKLANRLIDFIFPFRRKS